MGAPACAAAEAEGAAPGTIMDQLSDFYAAHMLSRGWSALSEPYFKQIAPPALWRQTGAASKAELWNLMTNSRRWQWSLTKNGGGKMLMPVIPTVRQADCLVDASFCDVGNVVTHIEVHDLKAFSEFIHGNPDRRANAEIIAAALKVCDSGKRGRKHGWFTDDSDAATKLLRQEAIAGSILRAAALAASRARGRGGGRGRSRGEGGAASGRHRSCHRRSGIQ